MKYLPVSNSYSKKIPQKDKPGSFWENRKDRFHCGVDIYAPKLSNVISVDSGKVIDSGVFTSPTDVKYWNTTYFLDIQNNEGICYRYAELNNINFNTGDNVKAGDIVGFVGQVLDVSNIDKTSPFYIQKLKNNNHLSMLHFEIYKGLPVKSKKYFGGNWFGDKRPNVLLDPTEFFFVYFVLIYFFILCILFLHNCW